MKTESSRNRLASIETVDRAARENVNLRIMCKGCGRTRVIPAQPLEGLARLRRWPTHLMGLSCKLRCGTCGGKSVELKVTEEPIDGPAIGPTTEREWQALVRRLRD
jgi:hypothetical protein